MKGEDLPPDDHVLRHCRQRDLKQEADGEIRGVFPHAFDPDSDGISVTWIEHFPGSYEERIDLTRQAIGRGLRLGASHRLAVLNVRSINEIGRTRTNPIRVVHDPIDSPVERSNTGHSLIIGAHPSDEDAKNRLANLVLRLELGKI